MLVNWFLLRTVFFFFVFYKKKAQFLRKLPILRRVPNLWSGFRLCILSLSNWTISQFQCLSVAAPKSQKNEWISYKKKLVVPNIFLFCKVCHLVFYAWKMGISVCCPKWTYHHPHMVFLAGNYILRFSRPEWSSKMKNVFRWNASIFNLTCQPMMNLFY